MSILRERYFVNVFISECECLYLELARSLCHCAVQVHYIEAIWRTLLVSLKYLNVVGLFIFGGYIKGGCIYGS